MTDKCRQPALFLLAVVVALCGIRWLQLRSAPGETPAPILQEAPPEPARAPEPDAATAPRVTEREWEAIRLFKAVKHAVYEAESKTEADRLLGKMRALAAAHPDDFRLQQLYMMGLNYTIYYAWERGDAATAQALETALEEHGKAYPHQEATQYVMAAHALSGMRRQARRGDCDALGEHIAFLGQASVQFPESERIRAFYLDALVTSLENNRCRLAPRERAVTLGSLVNLAFAHRSEHQARWHLAIGLDKMFHEALRSDDATTLATVVDHLASLSVQFPDDFLDDYARALENLIRHSKEHRRTEEALRLREALERLAQTHPEHAGIRNSLERLGSGR